MQLIWEGLQEAVQLIFAADPLILGAVLRTIWISTAAVGLAASVGIPFGVWLARAQFVGKRPLVLLFRAGMATADGVCGDDLLRVVFTTRCARSA